MSQRHVLLTRQHDMKYFARVMAVRSYESPLREEQMEQTRRRILEAVAEALADAFAEWAEENLQLLFHSYPETLEGVVEMAPALYQRYDENEPLIRAMLSPRGHEFRARSRRSRLRAYETAMSELTAGLEPAERRRALAVVYLLVSAPAWQAMRTQFGLDGVEAGKAAAWAVRVLTDELRRNPTSIKEA